MGSEELLQERIALGKPVYVTPFSRTITYPFHAVNHHTAIGKLYFDGGKLGNYFYQSCFQTTIEKKTECEEQDLRLFQL